MGWCHVTDQMTSVTCQHAGETIILQTGLSDTYRGRHAGHIQRGVRPAGVVLDCGEMHLDWFVLRSRWQKVIVDIWRNRARTLIVSLAIAVGVFATGTVLNAREILVREYGSDQDGALMASAILHTVPFDDDLADRIAEIPGVAAAEGRQDVRTRVTSVTGDRRDLILVAVPEFGNMQVDVLTPLEGSTSPGKRQVLLERQSLEYLGVEIGETVTVELDGGTEKMLEIVGSVHDPQQVSPRISSRASGYVTPETMGALGLDELHNELHVRVAEQPHDETHIQTIIDQVEDHLESTGRPVFARTIISESLADPFIDTVVLILTSLGFIILILSSFLVVNALTALITQQVPQIGVMKLLGARRSQIMSLYMVTVLVYSLLAIAIGIPPALLTARYLMGSIVEPLLNVISDSYDVPVALVAVQAGVGLVLPLLAGLAPVIKGTSITTHKALNDTGLDAGAYGQGWAEQALGWLQRIAKLRRPLLLALRNTFRRKGRLVQTLVVLIVGTALFISVLTVRASVDATLDSFMRFHGYDVSLSMERPYRLDRLEGVAREVPGIVHVEGWSVGGATRLRADGSESEGMRVYAVPPKSLLMDPEISDGEWLSDSAHNRLVINSDVVDKEPDLWVGEEIVLDVAGREAVWQIVGVVPTESRGPTIYMNLDDYSYATRTPGQATHLLAVTERHDAESQHEMALRLYERMETRGLEVSGTQTAQIMRQENELMFTVVVSFLILMALLLAAVGGLGLTTTMSINIMERVREIGVLRAVGASNAAVRQIVLVEGVLIGAVSWLLGTLLSLPISPLMSERLGLALIKVPLTYEYSIVAAVLWFFVLQGVVVVASLGPARDAVRLTIREVLAYE